MVPEGEQQALLDGSKGFLQFQDQVVQGRDLVVPQVVKGIMGQQVDREGENGIALQHSMWFYGV